MDFTILASLVASTLSKSVLPFYRTATLFALPSLLGQIITVAPLCSANSSAIANPIPFAEPVIRAILQFSNKS